MSTQNNSQKYYLFDDEPSNISSRNPNFTLTPCTRLERMALNSQSVGTRLKSVQYELPVTNLNDKLLQVFRKEESNQTHPNLDMFLVSDKISIMDKSKDNQSSTNNNTTNSSNFNYSEDEESDEGDLFSSSLLYPISPERLDNNKSYFDEPIYQSKNITKFLFDEDDDLMEEGCYDPTTSWLSNIYQDSSNLNEFTTDNNIIHNTISIELNNENIPPKYLFEEINQKKSKRDDNLIIERKPLREIRLDSDDEDINIHVSKKKMLNKSQKIRIMRALSPPRFSTKHKGKQSSTYPSK